MESNPIYRWRIDLKWTSWTPYSNRSLMFRVGGNVGSHQCSTSRAVTLNSISLYVDKCPDLDFCVSPVRRYEIKERRPVFTVSDPVGTLVHKSYRLEGGIGSRDALIHLVLDRWPRPNNSVDWKIEQTPQCKTPETQYRWFGSKKDYNLHPSLRSKG